MVLVVLGAGTVEAQIVTKGYATSLVLDEPIQPGPDRTITGGGAPAGLSVWVELWRVPPGSLRAESVTCVRAVGGNFAFPGIDVANGDDFYVTLSRSWHFDTPGDFEGWNNTNNSPDVLLDVADGTLLMTLRDHNLDGFWDGYVLNFVTYDPSLYRVVEVRMRNVAPAQPSSRFSVYWGSPWGQTISAHLANMPVEMEDFETIQFPMNVGEVQITPGPIELDLDGLWASGEENDVLRLDPWDGIPQNDPSLDGATFEIDWIRVREDYRFDFNNDGDPMGFGGAVGTTGESVFGGVFEYEVVDQASIFHDLFTGYLEVGHFSHLAIGLADPVAAIEDSSLALVFEDPLAGVLRRAEIAVQLSGRQDVFAAIDDLTVPTGAWTDAGRVPTSNLALELPAAGTAGDRVRIDYVALVPPNPWGPSDPVLAATPNNSPTAVITTDPESARIRLKNGLAVVLLDGAGSDDGDGGTQGLSFFWEKVSGPEGDIVAAPDAPATLLALVAPGEYVYRLLVDDGAFLNPSASAEVIVTVTEPPKILFLRGDADSDSHSMTLRDAIWIVRGLCKRRHGQEQLACADAADVDDSGVVDLVDATHILRYRFCRNAPPPPMPFPECGDDPTPDDLPECSYDETQCDDTTETGSHRKPDRRHRHRRR